MKKLLFLLIVLLISVSCENVNQTSPIPDMAVQLAINIMQDAPELNAMGGYKCYTQALTSGQYLGYGGIVIFHGFDDTFFAFDLSCPHEAKRDVRIEVNMGGTGKCPECGSVYDVGFGSGSPSSGPSKHILRQYKVIVNGYNLRVVR